MITTEVIVVDKGWNRVTNRINNLNGSFIKIGLPSEGVVKNGFQQGSGREESTDMISLAEIALINEFGDGNIPSRPAIRKTFDDNKELIIDYVKRQYALYVEEAINIGTMLNKVGSFYSNLMKKEFLELRVPPNAPMTIQAKGFDDPLIDSGQTVETIQHVTGRA